jgi:TolB-like protein/class 3 adenylate cyclase/Tfp pilus assembly protein PilF
VTTVLLSSAPLHAIWPARRFQEFFSEHVDLAVVLLLGILYSPRPMPAESKAAIRLEIGHVLFIDIVGYSKLLISEQSELVGALNDAVREAGEFRSAEADGRLVRLPTGDGMALVFHDSPEQPARCALEISQSLRNHPKLQVRMGIHSGPVNEVADVNERANIAGAGINIAQRVMDCGDAGHILLSRHVAEDLQHYSEWRPYLHDVGQCEVKHGEMISIVNLYTEELGNPNPPRLKRAQSEVRKRRRNALVLAGSGVAALLVAGMLLLPRASARKVDKSIAVLPFTNLSDDKENTYFADGVQDDVLTNLSKIGDLKVISRTSVMQYRGQAPNAREIGKALNVSNILEGSVRRSGNKVRVNVQLIDANTDEHIWANDYDRDVTDVFAIQSDLAQKIAEALQAKLSPGEKSQMTRKPTENGEAYLAFVQARNLSCAFEDFDKLKQGEQLYERAVGLDPKFALALAGYSQLESWILHTFDRTPQRREKAHSLAERALQLQPDLPEAHLALGYSYYYGDNNYDAALREFEIAQHGLPNESDAYLAIGAIQRRQGKWAESTANIEKSASLNPKDSWPLQNLADNYQMLRNYDQANKTLDRALALDPTAYGPLEVKSKLAIAEKGDFSAAEKAFEALKSVPMTNEQKLRIAGARVGIFLLERKYKEGLQAAENLPDDQLAAAFQEHAVGGKYYYIGFARKSLQDDAGARSAFLKAKSTLEEGLKRSPDAADTYIQLAKVLAFLGEKGSALAEAQRATELLPETKDAFGGPEITAGVAEVYAILGDSDRAIEILDGLLIRPSTVTAQGLKVNPIWDPLRSDPRFQALIDKYGAKA